MLLRYTQAYQISCRIHKVYSFKGTVSVSQSAASDASMSKEYRIRNDVKPSGFVRS